MGYQTLTHIVDVYRLTIVSGKESYALTPVRTNLDVGVFPAGPEVLAVYPGVSSYQLYDIFIYEDVTLLNGDKLKSGSDEWIVRGVPQKFSNPYISYQRIVGEKVV
jgi:hypothetical protein